MSKEELLKRRQLITHLELIQYKFFNGRPEWTTIEFNDLQLYMAYTYFGTPRIDEDIDEPDDIFSYYSTEEKKLILDVMNIVEKNIIKSKRSIEVGMTLTHSICKNMCEVCWDFPTKEIHQWCLFRIKSDDVITFIDPQHKRTYKNWNDYLKSNNLPEGVMFYPPLGYYDESKFLEHTVTPASKLSSKTLKKIDTLGNAMNFVSGIIMAGGLVFPILTPLIIPSVVTCISANAYTATRSVGKITDLVLHNQSLSSSKGCEYLMDLGISLLGTVTAFGNTSKILASEVNTSTFLLPTLEKSKSLRTLMAINSGACVLECTLEVFRLSMRIRDKKKLNIQDFITLRLDLFVAIGILWPMHRVIHTFEAISVKVAAGIYFREILSFPYYLGQLWFQGIGFIKEHFKEFMSQVTKFLKKNLTKDRALFAYKFFTKQLASYQKQRKSLSVNDLLTHIVDDTSLKCNEEESVKNILSGQHMLEILYKSQKNIDHLLIRFCIDYIIEKATNLKVKFDQCVDILFEKSGTSDLKEIKNQFCKEYELENCCMSQYVLHSLKETSMDIESLLDAYHTYLSKSFYSKHLVKSETIDTQSIDTYQVSVSSDNLDHATCVAYAQAIDSNNQNFKDYKFVKSESNISILFSVEWLMVKILFFHVDTVEGIQSLNISCYHNSNFNLTPQVKI